MRWQWGTSASMESAGRHTGTIEPHRAALGGGTSAGTFVAGSDPEDSPAPGPRPGQNLANALPGDQPLVPGRLRFGELSEYPVRHLPKLLHALARGQLQLLRRPTTDAIPAPPPTRQPNGPSMPRHAGIMPELRKPADQVRYDHGF